MCLDLEILAQSYWVVNSFLLLEGILHELAVKMTNNLR